MQGRRERGPVFVEPFMGPITLEFALGLGCGGALGVACSLLAGFGRRRESDPLRRVERARRDADSSTSGQAPPPIVHRVRSSHLSRAV
jgi:hypothetical protein